MISLYRVNPSEYQKIFAVPVAVADQYIQNAGSLSLKVLLLILRNADREISSEELAEKLNVSVSDIKDAANFWIINGNILQKTDKPEVNTPPLREEETGEKVKTITQRPIRLSGKEMEAKIKNSAEIRFLISETEKALGKNLLPSEASVLVSLHDWAGLSADMILMIIGYCIGNGKNNIRTIEKVALDWVDRGIDTHESLEAHIKMLTQKKNNEDLVRSAFGIFNRALTVKEKNFVNSWMTDMGFGIEMIKLAYEKCADNTGSLSFPYINKILLSWNSKNIRTPEEALQERKPTAERETGRSPSYDLADIEKRSLDDIV